LVPLMATNSGCGDAAMDKPGITDAVAPAAAAHVPRSRLAPSYVDQPPLAPLLARIVTSVLGVSPTAIRIIPALAGGAVAVIAARCAALFGADRFGRVLAALVTACAPVIFVSVHVDNTTPLDLLFWAAVVLCAATALLRGRARRRLAGLAAPPGPVHTVALGRRRHRRRDLGPEPDLAGGERLAGAGDGGGTAPREQLSQRLRRWPADPVAVRRAAGDPARHRRLRASLAYPRAARFSPSTASTAATTEQGKLGIWLRGS
jgi:hypothetical protein